MVPGLEGSGTVVAAGGGLLARRLLHKRVACAASNDGDGTWAEYTIAPAASCFPLPREIDDERGSMALVNPLAAWGLMEQARHAHARAVVNTAAASELGRMLVRLGKRFGIEVICVVRRAEQVELLRSLGASYVLNSTSDDFDAQLRSVAAQVNANMAFDAVGGNMTERLLAAMPQHSRITLYGGLSAQPASIQLQQPIFQDKVLDGFWIPTWIARKNLLQLILLQRSVLGLLGSDLRSEIRARFPLEHAQQAVETYESDMTGGKVLLIPTRRA
jgi:NADPH:quinone reductase-like Zn-dependent oxidoreductase